MNSDRSISQLSNKISSRKENMEFPTMRFSDDLLKAIGHHEEVVAVKCIA